MEESDRIDASNLCTYLSMDFAKRYFVWYYAAAITDEADINKVTTFLGSSPLNKKDLNALNIFNDPKVWKEYGHFYKSITGESLTD